ncbi:hypothetical protein B0H17DRAFT_1060682 [Mycena rosella]|uniref:Uncharacterized protein n=1 Tax=Mycena rosella TaxID=1033263 RepID=A0AAD7DMK0_MYCRO|nr:hypothetical protein B0H17DRAFT_1060682 [Mycena rosella]
MVAGRYNRANSAVFTVSPFNLLNPEIPAGSPDPSGTRNSHRSTLRQQYLQNELRAVREKMVDMAELQRAGAGALGRILRFMPIRQPTPRASHASGGLASQLEASRARNEALAARICELETQIHSEWALGLSDEPPPGYMA